MVEETHYRNYYRIIWLAVSTGTSKNNVAQCGEAEEASGIENHAYFWWLPENDKVNL